MSSDQETDGKHDAHDSDDGDVTVSKWWVVMDDKPEGPHTAAFMSVLLQEGRIEPTTMVCQAGQGEWCPILESAELVAEVEKQAPGSLPPALPAKLSPSQRPAEGIRSRLTNPGFPRFANWLCVYCIVIVPAYCLLGILATLVVNTASDLKDESPLVVHAVTWDVLSIVTDIALAAVFVFGGLLLRNLNQKGVGLIKVGVVITLCRGLTFGFLFVLWDAMTTVSDATKPMSDELVADDIAALVLGIPLVLVGIASVVFEIVALIWLINNDHRLPLKQHADLQALEEHKQ